MPSVDTDASRGSEPQPLDFGGGWGVRSPETNPPGCGVMATMEDIRPHGLGGDLAQVPLASVLITALKQKVSGELSIEHASGQDQVYFQEGVPTGTHVLHAFKPLGRLLLEMGWIDMDALNQSLELMSQGRRQGEALLEIGALDEVQLNAALRLLQIRNLVELAKLP